MIGAWVTIWALHKDVKVYEGQVQAPSGYHWHIHTIHYMDDSEVHMLKNSSNKSEVIDKMDNKVELIIQINQL